MRRFEFVEGSSSKFWEIALSGASFTVRYGRIGTNGQEQGKSFPTDAKAKAEHDKLIAEKTKKGYEEVGAPQAAATPETPAGAAPVAVAPPKPKAPKPPREEAVIAHVPTDGWMAVGSYAVQIRDGGLVARNDKGKELASLPKAIKDGEVGEALLDAVAFLEAHDQECRETVESWMLRSLPVPRAVLSATWADPAWKTPLANLVVRAGGTVGILLSVEARGLGVVDLDGETRWLNTDRIEIPHPILLDDLDDWRGLLSELALTQGTAQLFRETFVKPAPGTREAENASVDAYQGGEFPMLAIVSNEARKQGYRVSGGCSICRVWTPAGLVEARFELGEGDPTYETSTGSLRWVDGKQSTLKVGDVGPVAYSEGMRMASSLYAKRTIPTEKEDDDV